MVTSIKLGRKYDDACELDVGDHPYLTKPSYLLYRMAECTSVRHIVNMVAKQYYNPRQDMSDPVLIKIIDGLYDSEDTKARIIKYANVNNI